MTSNCERYKQALRRNLFELRDALSERNAINALVKVAPVTRWSYFSYADIALSNDMLSHAMKILDTHKDSVSFWFLYNRKKEEIDEYLNDLDLSLSELKKMTEDLKLIRDKTHFHIDKIGVFDPASIWDEAGITGNFFNKVFESLWEVLNKLYESQHGVRFEQPIYNGDDVSKIVDCLIKNGIFI